MQIFNNNKNKICILPWSHQSRHGPRLGDATHYNKQKHNQIKYINKDFFYLRSFICNKTICSKGVLAFIDDCNVIS